MSDAVVYTVLPIVNDPFGKCLFVPAMIACTRAKAAALVLVDVLVVLDMYVFLLSEGGAKAGRSEPLGAGVLRGIRASCSRPSYGHSGARRQFRAQREEIDMRRSISGRECAEGRAFITFSRPQPRPRACPTRPKRIQW